MKSPDEREALLVGPSGACQILRMAPAHSGGQAAPQKQELIRGLLKLTKARENAQEVTDTMLSNMESSYPKVIASILSHSQDLSTADREELQKEVTDSQKRFSQKFRESYAERVSFDQLIDEIYIPLYDKLYSEQELQDLVKFYQSPTGQKVVDTMPKLMHESMQKSAEMINPKVVEMVDQILDEERKKIESSLGWPATPAGV